MLPRVSVLIIEDHELLAQSLGVALQAEGLAVEVAQLAGGADLLEQAAASRPAVVLLDLDLGDGREGGEALVPGLVALGAVVVVVSGASDPLRLGTCLELGAAAVLPKTRGFEEVLDAVLKAAAGERVMPDHDRQALLADMRRRRSQEQARVAPFERLTAREREVLGHLMGGRSAEAIAGIFVVSEATVRTQVRGVLTKLGVTSQLAAVAEAHRLGWRPSDN